MGYNKGNGNGNGMLTPSEVARLLNVHINTVRRWDDNGTLKAYRVGTRRDRRFSREDVQLFLAGCYGNEKKLVDCYNGR